MIDLLNPVSKYFQVFGDDDHHYWTESPPGVLTRTGRWTWWDYDGYLSCCYFVDAYNGGIPDNPDPDTLYCTLTTSVTVALCMAILERGYSGRWAWSNVTFCLAGVPSVITLPFTSFGYGHEALAFAIIGESANLTFTLTITNLTLGAVIPIMPFWKDFVNCEEVDT